MGERPVERAVSAFRGAFGREPALVVHAPGRVNLLGEHVDYHEGLVLPAAIGLDLALAGDVAPRGEGRLRSLEAAGEARIAEGAGARAGTTGWAAPVAAVARALGDRGVPTPALDAVIASDLPIGAGLSSSAALEAAFVLAWDALAGADLDRPAMSSLCRDAENRFLGVRSGLMDPFAVLHGREGCAIRLDCRTGKGRPVRLPPGASIVVADSGVPRRLGETAYNRRREEGEEALERLRTRRPSLVSLRDVAPADLPGILSSLPEPLGRRVRHVVEEIARVASLDPEAPDAAALGSAMDASHESLRALYEVSHPALDRLVAIARALPGCAGSRLTGAGFGGCTVSLVLSIEAAGFAAELAARARAEGLAACRTWALHAVAGAAVLRRPR